MLPTSTRISLGAAGLAILASCTAGSSGPSGTYETRDSTGFMTLDFKSGGKVHMVTEERGQRDSADADYTVDGNKITVQVPGGMPLVLTKNGDQMDASMMGEIMHFKKK
jgi:hypothetical protein